MLYYCAVKKKHLMNLRVLGQFFPAIAIASVTCFTPLAMVEPVRALTIDTFPSWDGTSSIGSWGYQVTPTYGQTITIDEPSGLILDSFSVSVKTDVPRPYQARVYRWDPLKGSYGSSIGSPLYSGGIGSIGGTNNLFESVTINTGGVSLPGGGKQYVLLLTTEGLTGQGVGRWGFLGSDVYAGGSFVYTNYPISQDWDSSFTSTQDLAFSASLRAIVGVPGPLPMAGASVALALSRRLRRRIKGADAESQG